MQLIRTVLAGLVVVAIVPWSGRTDAQTAEPSEPVRVYPASACIQQFGDSTSFALGEFLSDGVTPKGYAVGRNGAFRPEVVDVLTNPPQNPAPGRSNNTFRVYCSIELDDLSTRLSVDVATDPNGPLPVVYPGIPQEDYVSCRVVVANLDGCTGTPGSCPTANPGGDVVPTQTYVLARSGSNQLIVNDIPLTSNWSTSTGQYALLACDLRFGRGMFSYKVSLAGD